MARKKGKNAGKKNGPQPWIPRNTGYIAIAVVSIGLAVWVAWQVIAAGQNIGKGILWGLLYGGSIWLVFFGMNIFHKLFRGKRD